MMLQVEEDCRIVPLSKEMDGSALVLDSNHCQKFNFLFQLWSDVFNSPDTCKYFSSAKVRHFHLHGEAQQSSTASVMQHSSKEGIWISLCAKTMSRRVLRYGTCL